MFFCGCCGCVLTASIMAREGRKHVMNILQRYFVPRYHSNFFNFEKFVDNPLLLTVKTMALLGKLRCTMILHVGFMITFVIVIHLWLSTM